MDLTAHYNELYSVSYQKIKNGEYHTDQLIDDATDTRFGITLLIRPPEHVKNKIQEFLSEVKHIDPDQYFYPNTDIHITVMSIISCYPGFTLDQIQIEQYIEVVKQSLENINAFNILFKGITLSPAGVMIQGFLENNTLNTLRDALRENFKNTALQQSIDKRYALKTAHATVVRFRQELNDVNALLLCAEKYKDHPFGSFTVDTLELVYNDWYQRAENTVSLHHFSLK